MGVGGRPRFKGIIVRSAPFRPVPLPPFHAPQGNMHGLLQAEQMKAVAGPGLKDPHPTIPWPAWCPWLKHLGKCFDHVSSAQEKRAVSRWCGSE